MTLFRERRGQPAPGPLAAAGHDTFRNLRQANRALRARLANLDPNGTPGTVFDFAFAPHNHYHMMTAFPVAERVRRGGLSVCFLDFTKVLRDEGLQGAVARLEERHCRDVSAFIAAGHGFRNLVVFNDWDRQSTHPLVLDAKEMGISTIGFVEGVNDFDDVDTGKRRNAYRTVEWVLGAGENDRRFFDALGDRFRVVGFPRIADDLLRPRQAPSRMRAVINVNFTYNVLTHERDRWLTSAIEGCRVAGIEYVISRHPADKGDLAGHPLDPRSFHESMTENAVLISRFSSCIIEALALGRAVVYHNPDVERVDKFRDPLGAYSVSTDVSSLAGSLKFELAREGSVVDRRSRFLAEHCDFSDNFIPYEKAAEVLREIHAAHAPAAREPGSRAVNPSPSMTTESTAGRASNPLARLMASEHARRWPVSPTAWLLAAGLALVGAGFTDVIRSVWFAAAGLAVVGLVIAKESILWRWRLDRTRGELAAQRAESRKFAEALAAERGRAEKALSKALAAERSRAEKALNAALAAERSRRSLVDVHLADRDLPVRRVLLLCTTQRSGSTWLFDMLRTHPAVRVEPTVRVWSELLLMDGWRYPGAFHHVDGASTPIEVAPGLAAAIPTFPRAGVPDVRDVDEADRWTLEKTHPQFVEFDAAGLGARIMSLRKRGVDVEVVYGVRSPLDTMWSMAEFKTRDRKWYGRLPVAEVPRFIAKSLDVLAALHALVGGTIVEYETLPDGAVMNTLCRRLDPSWNDAAVKAWLVHAAAVTERSRRRQRSGFLGKTRSRRDPDGPDRAWLPCAAEIEAADAAYRRLLAAREPASMVG